MSARLCLLWWLVWFLCFRFGALAGLGGLCAGRVFVCFCVGGGVGTQGGVGWLWGCFKPPGGLLCRPYWGGGPGVGLTLCCFVVCSAGRFVVGLSMCRFVLVFFGPFVAVASLVGGWEGWSWCFSCVCSVVLVWVCRFPLPLRIWEGLRFVIVALPGLFSYLFSSIIIDRFCTKPVSFKFIVTDYLSQSYLIFRSSPYLSFPTYIEIFIQQAHLSKTY